MRNGFDEEMKKRLFNLTEEPDEGLWHRLVPRMPKSGRHYGGAAKAILVIIVLGSLVILVESDVDMPYRINAAASSSEVIRNLAVEKPGAAFPKRVVDNIGERAMPSNEIQPVTSSQFSGEKNGLAAKHVAQIQVLRPGAPDHLAVLLAETETRSGSDSNGTANKTPELNVQPNLQYKDSATADEPAKKEIKVSAVRERTRQKQEAGRHKFNMYFTAMPTFGYQRIESNGNDNVVIESIKRIPSFSTNRLGVRVEAGFEFPLNNRIKFFSGLLYYQRKQTIGYTQRVVENTVISTDPAGNIILTPDYVHLDKSFEYELKNLGLQVGLNFLLRKGVLLQTMGTGMELQMALNKIHAAAKAEGFTSNPSAYVFYNLYYRLQYPAEGRLKTVFQPTLNYSFYINQNVNAPFYVKPYGLGLNIGCTYNF